MASRAQAVHHYDFPERPRREVWYRADDEERVSLPRHKQGGGGAALAVSALIASGVIAAGAFALYFAEPPALAQTPTLAFSPTWTLDGEPLAAQNRRVIAGPALAALSVAAEPAAQEETDTPSSANMSMSQPEPHETFIDDSLPSSQPLLPEPISKPEAPPSVPYPNPTTTPPEGFASPDATPLPAQPLDPENPYRN